MSGSTVRSKKLEKSYHNTTVRLELSCDKIIQKIRNDPSLGVQNIKAACIETGEHGFGMAIGPFILPKGGGYIICAKSKDADNLYSWIRKAEALLAELNEIHTKIGTLCSAQNKR